MLSDNGFNIMVVLPGKEKHCHSRTELGDLESYLENVPPEATRPPILFHSNNLDYNVDDSNDGDNNRSVTV